MWVSFDTTTTGSLVICKGLQFGGSASSPLGVLPLGGDLSQRAGPRRPGEGLEVLDQRLHLLVGDVAGAERGGDVGPDGAEGLRDPNAGDGDEPSLPAGEAGPQPEVAEDEVEDAGEEVGRVLRRGPDEVDLLE